MLECDDAEKFTGINRRCGIKVIQALHLPCEVGARQNPSATQPAQPINFRQTAGHDELVSQIEGGARRFGEKHLQINFIHQNACLSLCGQFSDFLHCVVVGQNAAGIMEVSYYN